MLVSLVCVSLDTQNKEDTLIDSQIGISSYLGIRLPPESFVLLASKCILLCQFLL